MLSRAPALRRSFCISLECPPGCMSYLCDSKRACGTYETVPSRAHVPNDVGLGDAEQPGRHWVSTCDSFNLDSDTTDPDPGSDTLFSLYLRSPSPSSSTELPSECSGETLVPVDSELSSPRPRSQSLNTAQTISWTE
jgi:hypothetical protein